MQTQIRKIGNSSGVIIPEQILAQAHLEVGDVVNIMDSENGIFITPFAKDFNDIQTHYKTFSKKYKNALSALAK